MTKISKECVFDAVARDNDFAKCHMVTDWYWSGDDELVFCTNKRTHETEHYTVEEFVRQMSNFYTIDPNSDMIDFDSKSDSFVFKRRGE